MLWNNQNTYLDEPFASESELESAIREVAPQLFGPTRLYLDIKRRIGIRGRTQNVPDGYLIDLSSNKEPKLFVVENELSEHDPLKHVAVQVLEFSLSFETTPHVVKTIVKEALAHDAEAMSKCQTYASVNGFENVDYLLERMTFGHTTFNAIVIIDSLSDELENVLTSRFQFPVEILTLKRYRNASGERLYEFDPFLADLFNADTLVNGLASVDKIDPAEIDTIVVPARTDGFDSVFLGEDRWFAIRIHSSMIPRIRYIAAYRVRPESAITHIAQVAGIKHWQDTSKYVVDFASHAEPIGPIPLKVGGRVKAPQAPRYTSRERLMAAKSLDDVF